MSPRRGGTPRSPARFDDFERGAVDLAQRLLGHHLVRIDDDGVRCAGVVVETEAYVGPLDRAAHTFGGRRTPRTESMYLAGGHAYVYFVYGMHWCFNVVAGPEGAGEAVLIRALRPVDGLDQLRTRRRGAVDRLLCSGPARLAAAMGIDGALDGEDLRSSGRLFIEPRRRVRRAEVVAAARVGVQYAGEWAERRWRFLLAEERAWWSKGVAAPKRPPAGDDA